MENNNLNTTNANQLSEGKQIVKRILTEMLTYSNDVEINLYLRGLNLLNQASLVIFGHTIPEAEAFQGPVMPPSIKQLVSKIVTYSRFYQQHILPDTARVLYEANSRPTQFGSSPNPSISDMNTYMEIAEYNLADYIYYIFIPLKYRELSEFVRRFLEFSTDLQRSRVLQKNVMSSRKTHILGENIFTFKQIRNVQLSSLRSLC